MNDMQTLEDFILEHFNSKAEFARLLGVFPQQINTWERAGYRVHNGILYKPMRQLAEIENA